MNTKPINSALSLLTLIYENKIYNHINSLPFIKNDTKENTEKSINQK